VNPAVGAWPRVSCLMVTKDRPVLAARAIRCFADQRYPARELVIVCQGTAGYRSRLTGLARAHGVSEVRIVDADPDLPLGALRNLSLDAAAGELVCVWDDDDCSHPDGREAEIRAAMVYYAVPNPVRVHGSDGPVFSIDD
jgi:glycosyltransferase involved in cell wall biosynthesis